MIDVLLYGCQLTCCCLRMSVKQFVLTKSDDLVAFLRTRKRGFNLVLRVHGVQNKKMTQLTNELCVLLPHNEVKAFEALFRDVQSRPTHVQINDTIWYLPTYI
uniref:DUF4911 domain-containing protein n=1 Tax=Panagrellus redivivus TaxID=6233 RepID=A0A7E4V397_PANRE